MLFTCVINTSPSQSPASVPYLSQDNAPTSIKCHFASIIFIHVPRACSTIQMFSLRSRDDPQDAYARNRANLGQLPDDRLYPQQHSMSRNHPYSPVDDMSGHFGQRRFASGSPTTRFQDHGDYPIPQGLPTGSAGRLGEMSRIDTSPPYPRRESQLNNQPVSATSLDLSGDSEAWSPTQSSRPRKSRREKPRIELAPDQPPTTQGKPRARVYVACIQWYVLFSPPPTKTVFFSYAVPQSDSQNSL